MKYGHVSIFVLPNKNNGVLTGPVWLHSNFDIATSIHLE